MKKGLYEKVISTGLSEDLNKFDDDCKYIEEIDREEAPIVLSDYVSKALRKALEKVIDKADEEDKGLDIVNKVMEVIGDEKDFIEGKGEILRSFNPNMADMKITGKDAKKIQRPETSVSYSSLFTGSAREPSMYSEITKEIGSADEIMMLVSFIKWSGLRLIIDELRNFTDRGGRLRVITTTYMAATEVKAIEELRKLRNTQVKISYDIKRTRLHAKSYIFCRDSGYSTAYVGSSNLSNPAMTEGLEWNVKITKNDMPDVFTKVNATFESYWNSDEFELYEEGSEDKLRTALKKEKGDGKSTLTNYYFEIHPYPYQQMILDKLEAERENLGINKNLVVAATGTGKTIIAAFDYKEQCRKKGKKVNLLFIAHRKEILQQSLECFREVLNDPQFGEIFTGDSSPENYTHLFATVGVVNSRKIWEMLDSGFFEMIVLDECHHMAASSYQGIINNFKPEILLGLTATPERMDGGNILEYFDGRISAEIRLPEAINRKLLCPFQYYGVEDSVDLSDVKWTRGGYDISELENLYIFNTEIAKKRAKNIVNALIRYVSDIDEVKGLAFCVSREHAIFMAKMFNEHGIASECVISGSFEDDEVRRKAKQRLESGEIKIICAVDIYNEGVDIKSVNTVLFLRPTESLTVFLQQLGRGLRLSEGKDCLTVLDFVGQANKRYSFEGKFNALMEKTRNSFKTELESGFPNLPKGCYIKLEEKARDRILNNIRASVGEKGSLTQKIRFFEDDTGKELSYYNFLDHYKYDPRIIYNTNMTFGELCALEHKGDKPFYKDANIAKKLKRLASVDSRNWLMFIEKMVTRHEENRVNFGKSELEIQYLKMLYVTFFDEAVKENTDFKLELERYLFENSEIKNEISELIKYRLENTEFISKTGGLPFINSLETYCTYTRAQILASLNYFKVSREGVTRVPEYRTTCLFVTLNKSEKYYSPSTLYHDYSINCELFHWQSQNSTSPESKTGMRFINHREMNENILLFVREEKQDMYGTVAYTYLGVADFVSTNGSKPMNIVWKLRNRIPAKYLKITDKLGIN